MGVGRGVLATPWILKFSAKKSCIFSFEGKNQIPPLFAPPWKNSGKIPSGPPPLGKILPKPMPVLQKVNLCESKLVDLTTEGVLSMIGKQNGFAELMMKAVPHAFMAHHYVIPQEDLC